MSDRMLLYAFAAKTGVQATHRDVPRGKTQEPGHCGPGSPVANRNRWADAYLSAVDTEVKVAFRLEPTVPTTVMMATEMPAAIRPYSMAVAPDSSLANLRSEE